MNKLTIFGCTRNSLIGDIIVSLPFLTFLEKEYPNSFKCSYIDKKCSQIIPFLINHPLIDKIQISDEVDNVTLKDKEFINKFDIKYHPFPQHPYEQDYWNHRDFVHETFLMNYRIGEGHINPDEWNKLNNNERYPKLNQWFDIEKPKKRTIAIWPTSGYSSTNGVSRNLRSPSMEWWTKLVQSCPDYDFLQFGVPDSELIENYNIKDCRKLSLFEAAKMSMSCRVSITTDSGISWILGAYGVNQIVLYTNYNIDHNTNFNAFCPVNHKNHAIFLYGKDKIIDNIEQHNVLEAIKNFK